MAYPYLIAEAMGADLSVMALSGQGLTVGNPGIFAGYKYASPNRSMKTEYGFARKADYSILNVGTNDAFQNLSAADFEAKLKAFVAVVREKNGADCRIVLVGGMMKTEYNDIIKRVTHELGGAAEKYYVYIADQAAGGNHPTEAEHKEYAELLGGMLDAIEKDAAYDAKEQPLMKIGVHILPRFPKDNTDRNRTSPFAFTGNKFEFRMLGSTLSIAGPNTVLNTAVAESLDDFATELETASDFNAAVHALIVRTLKEHKRIIFNGNGYDDAWIAEAEKRGLLNLRSTPECLPYLIRKENIALFEKYRIYTRSELHSRYEILLDNYSKVMNIEAETMLDMAQKEILPAVESYERELTETALAKKQLLPQAGRMVEERLGEKLSPALSCSFYQKMDALEAALVNAREQKDALALANYYHDVVFAAMQDMRVDADQLEATTAKKYWPYPTYSDLLFGVQ